MKPEVRRIGSLVNQLMSRRGYAQALANQELKSAIADVVDEALRDSFEVGNLRGGVLQVFATDSVALQELNFQKRAILGTLTRVLPENQITDIRFRIRS